MSQRFVAGLVQMTSGTEIAENVKVASALIREAKARGAQFVMTPENTTQIEPDKARVLAEAQPEASHPAIPPFRALAQELGLWLLVGSLTVKASDSKCWNRSYLFAPDGAIAARYDKIHMFDVTVSEGEVYRESAAYRPGDRAVVVDTPLGRIGLAICYDLRFPHLHRALGRAGAEIILNPAAFTVPTGRAHWEVLLRARAIETGAFVLAAAQTGLHPRTVEAPERRTWGHSLAIAPWGEVLVDAGEPAGVSVVDLDLALVKDARRRIPALTHDPDFTGP